MSSRSVAVNALTFSRVPFIFAWLGFAVAFEFHRSLPLMVAACAMMFLSGITDLFDGLLARRWNVVTPLGKMADPLMDKVFYAVAFPALTACTNPSSSTVTTDGKLDTYENFVSVAFSG